MKQSLERYRAFPIFAWTVVFGLLILTFYLIDVLRVEIARIESIKSQTETVLETNLEKESWE